MAALTQEVGAPQNMNVNAEEAMEKQLAEATRRERLRATAAKVEVEQEARQVSSPYLRVSPYISVYLPYISLISPLYLP